MKLNLIKSYWLKTKAVASTAKTTFRALMLSSNKISDFDAIIFQWINELISIYKIKPVVNNPHHVTIESGKRYIIMCNHASFLDIPLSYKAFDNISLRMLAKKELSKVPFFGKAMARSGFPFVNRQNRSQAIKDLEKAKQLMEQDNVVLWIAPEGTRSRTGKLQPFKKGGFITAIQSQAIIIPLAIKGAFEVSPYGSKHININQQVSLNIGTPIDASEYQLNQKEQLLQLTQKQMEQLLET